MKVIVSHPAPSAHSNDDLGDTACDERLRGLSREELADRLRWLSWWAPGAFAATMDYMEAAEAFADGTASAGA